MSEQGIVRTSDDVLGVLLAWEAGEFTAGQAAAMLGRDLVEVREMRDEVLGRLVAELTPRWAALAGHVDRRVCISAGPPHDFEAWVPNVLNSSSGRERFHAAIAGARESLGCDRGLPLYVENWPEVLEDYRRAGLIGGDE